MSICKDCNEPTSDFVLATSVLKGYCKACDTSLEERTAKAKTYSVRDLKFSVNIDGKEQEILPFKVDGFKVDSEGDGEIKESSTKSYSKCKTRWRYDNKAPGGVSFEVDENVPDNTAILINLPEPAEDPDVFDSDGVLDCEKAKQYISKQISKELKEEIRKVYGTSHGPSGPPVVRTLAALEAAVESVPGIFSYGVQDLLNGSVVLYLEVYDAFDPEIIEESIREEASRVLTACVFLSIKILPPMKQI